MMENTKAGTITGYLIDVQKETAGAVTIEKSLRGYYEALDCSLIAMPEHKIGVRNGRRYTIIADDEGLFVDYPKISAINNLGQTMLVGNLLIVKVDEDGETQSLDADDIAYIDRFVLKQATRVYTRPYPMLHQCEYAW